MHYWILGGYAAVACVVIGYLLRSRNDGFISFVMGTIWPVALLLLLGARISEWVTKTEERE